MCTATAARQAAPRYQMADTAYEMARESEPESFLEMCIAATMAAPQTIAAAVAAAPPAPLPVVKPAAVAKPAAGRRQQRLSRMGWRELLDLPIQPAARRS